MKFWMMVLSFFLGNAKGLFKGSANTFSRQIVLHLRALVTLILSSVGSLALFCSGFYWFLTQAASQWDQNGELRASAGLLLSAALATLSLFGLIYSLNSKTWLKATGFASENPPPKPSVSPLENAVALLIMDFVNEREKKRQAQEENRNV